MNQASSNEGIGFSRRSFLRIAGIGGAALAASPRFIGTAEAAKSPSLWSNPKTWGGEVPGRNDVAVISKPVLLDQNARVAGIRIQPGGSLIFERDRNLTLKSTGNIVVRGLLSVQPKSSKLHRIVFLNIDESKFQGGGQEVLDSDVGLWVMDSGRLKVTGSYKLPWTRTQGGVAKGTKRIRLNNEPIGWRRGDEVAIVPTAGPRHDAHTSYDIATITAISGRTITLNKKTQYPHPAVHVGRGRVMTPEVLNLTRNARISGTAGGRTHVLIHSHQPQLVMYASIRHTGPRQEAEEFTKGVLGRYGLHFHISGHGSHSSYVRGVVVRDSGSHAFVTHLSHGVTLRGCISHDTFDEAFWYDGPPNNLVYDHCVASLVRSDPEFRGFRIAGFFLGEGKKNEVRGCVAVGILGTSESSGYIWPEGSEGVWKFHDNVSHNNNVHGIFTWQNTGTEHTVERFTAYHNGGAGISHGAYKNPYRYRDSILYGNALSAIDLHATASADGLRFTNIACDQAGLSDYAVAVGSHNLGPDARTKFTDCSFRGYKDAAIGFIGNESHPDRVDLVDCTYSHNEFWLTSSLHKASNIRVQDNRHGALLLRRKDRDGKLVAKWNARVKQIKPFA